MTTQYTLVYPLSQRSTYYSSENVDFVLNLDNQKLVPGSLVIEGECRVVVGGSTYNGEDVAYDHHAGFHGLFSSINTEFQNSGSQENFQSYPRYVKMNTVALNYDESLGTESINAVEGKFMNKRQAQGLMFGRSATNGYVPFSLKPLICLNKASAPISGNSTGQVRLRLRLSADEEFLYGSAFVLGTVKYELQQLRLRYLTVPDDGKLAAVNMEVIQTFRSALESQNQNVSTFIPGLCDSVVMSFISSYAEGQVSSNYLQCAVPPGVPPLGTPATAANSGSYGIERMYYSVSDSDTAVVGFTLESREEIVSNALRAFKAPVDKYASLIRHYQEAVSDCYLAGMPFGSLLDFSRVKFATEIQSKCTNLTTDNTGSHIIYIYARCLTSMNA